MEDPKFGSNRVQSFIEFLSNLGPVKFGLEGKKLFYQQSDTDTKVFMTDENGNVAGLDADSVATINIQDYAVTTDKILNDAVTTAKILDDAVTTTKILNANVTAAKLAGALDLTAKDVRYSIKSGTAVNAVAAVGTLTLTGTVADGETFTVGTEVFEIDTNGSVLGANIAINVSAFAVAAQGTLTVTVGGTQIANNDTVTLDTKIYTFKTALTPTEGEVLIGANDTAALLNLKNALDLGGTPGTDYSCAAIHPTVKGISSNATTLIAEARTPGTAGNAIAATEVAAQLSWNGAGTLGTTVTGVDCSAANADGVIVTDATTGSAIIVATQGAGTTVLITMLIKGVAGNAVASTVTLANGSFGDTTLGDTVAGVDGTVGAIREILIDTTNIYIATAANTVADTNWRKILPDIGDTAVGQFARTGVITVKKTIGGIGISADFNFVTAANQSEQPIDLGAIIPAKARVIDIFCHTNAVFTGATTLVADLGLTTGAADFIASATIYATDAILAAAAASAPLLVPSVTAQHVWVNATPGANWSNVTAGKVTVYITYIDLTNV